MNERSTKTVDLIAGARPNFMKIAPIIDAMRARIQEGSPLRYRFVHTGQHYDTNMSQAFLEELGLPKPDHHLNVGSGTQAYQTARIMERYEDVLMSEPCDLCVVVGDVNSTMACAITAKKLHIPVAHVEGGLRSRNMRMPEEINRMVTDAISDIFYTTTPEAGAILRSEGHSADKIVFVGNTMIDSLLKYLPKARKPHVWEEQSLHEKEYFVLTMHRPANVDALRRFDQLIHVIDAAAGGTPVIFPVHPRTAKIIEQLPHRQWQSIRYTSPLPYLEFLYLLQHAKGIITDSGGITEEATVLGIPCITLRETTERPETVTIGTNELAGSDTEKIHYFIQKIIRGEWKKGSIPERWDGKAGERIVQHLEQWLFEF